ncbi:hypothetical protein FSP39_023030 [Pinctada imbricata]|uniref:Uncharacterized protein n=1 Tax=Pinctada imbricata TaxID=66713 RepID=A0AA89C303_PINIB|nr:hypothetical protein FSP39_023030 [Pinctada imbricata]
MLLRCIIFRNVPDGVSYSEFVETCEACGEIYGFDYSYDCLMDYTWEVFQNCHIAVNKK